MSARVHLVRRSGKRPIRFRAGKPGQGAQANRRLSFLNANMNAMAWATEITTYNTHDPEGNVLGLLDETCAACGGSGLLLGQGTFPTCVCLECRGSGVCNP